MKEHPAFRLSAREHQVLTMLESGLSVADISISTGLKPSTVHNYLATARVKIGIKPEGKNRCAEGKRNQIGLSLAQARVFDLLRTGISNLEIAEKLYITEKTVKFHITYIYKILKVKNRGAFLVKYGRANEN